MKSMLMRKRASLSACIFVMGVCILFPTPKIFADRLILKNGRRYEDVKLVPQGTYQFVVFSDGRLERIENSQIATLDLLPVRWKTGPDPAQIDRIVSKAVETETQRVRKEEAEKNRQETEARAATARSNLAGAFWRSALLPGWAQLHRGDTVRGFSFMGITALFFLNYMTARHAFFKAQNEYNDSLIPAALATTGQSGIIANIPLIQGRRSLLLTRERKVNTAVSLLAFVWVVNIADALYFAVDLSGRPSVSQENSPLSVSGDLKFRIGMQF